MIRLFFAMLSSIYCLSATHAQLIITEVLFNPVREGFDYVEGINLYPTSVNLADFRVANRNATGEVNTIKAMSKEPLSVAAGAYFVLTANAVWLRQHYRLEDSILVLQVALPSFNDDEGNVLFLNAADSVIDELKYSKDWHFPLLNDAEGVSLERIHIADSTQDKNNWTSAASSSGFGTPGFRNSHFREPQNEGGALLVQPRAFSPDNDGIDDFASLRITTAEPGWVANIRIYDVAGRCVNHFLKTEILGTVNDYKWFGIDERGRPLATGIYIVFAELFSRAGQTMRFKTTIVISNGRH